MEQITPTAPSQWKGKIHTEGTDVELPSGNVARVRQINPVDFLSSGLIPDPLTPIIKQAINSKRGLPPAAVKRISEDPELLTASLELFDRVLSNVTINPKISMPPACRVCNLYYNEPQHRDRRNESYHEYNEDDRNPDVLYADQVVMDDKVFVFNFVVGGTRDLEKFREELQAGMGSVPDE